jgi:hypothetical protein
MRHRITWASVLALGCVLMNGAAGASSPPVSVLKIEIENYVPYHYEVFEPSKFATTPDLTAAQPAIPFGQLIILGDIVAVNGRPVKGVWVLRATDLFLTNTVGVQPPNQPHKAGRPSPTCSEDTFKIWYGTFWTWTAIPSAQLRRVDSAGVRARRELLPM